MVANSIKEGDLVWAKMKHYPPWPGQVMQPPENKKVKKAHHYVFFFGSDNYAWIPDEMIFLHNKKLVEDYGTKRKDASFVKAVEIIVNKSKDISKYNKAPEVSETSSHEDSSPPQKSYESSSFKKYKTSTSTSSLSSAKKYTSSSNLSPKSKSLFSNSVSKKIKKRISVKSFTPVKKFVRKGSSSFEQSEDEDPHFTLKRSKDVEIPYASLMASIPPNLGYNGDSVHSTALSTGLLARKYVERPETPPLDLGIESQLLKTKMITPTTKKIGFLGLGKLGQGIVKNLQQSGHSVVIWNRTTEKCKPFVDKLNVEVAKTPADVIVAADITFCCVSDAEAAKALVFGNCGILRGLDTCGGEKKGYVEMTSMDARTSQAFADEIRLKGGRYLEAPVCGSRIEAHEGTLYIIAAGDQSLYDDCQSCFNAASKKHKFLGAEVGTAAKLGLIHSMLVGTVYAAMAESLALVSRTGLKGEDFLEILSCGMLHSDSIVRKGVSMINSDYVANTPLKHMQKDLNLGLMLGTSVEQPTPVIAMANEVYKHCRLLRYGDHDVSAVIEGTRP